MIHWHLGLAIDSMVGPTGILTSVRSLILHLISALLLSCSRLTRKPFVRCLLLGVRANSTPNCYSTAKDSGQTEKLRPHLSHPLLVWQGGICILGPVGDQCPIGTLLSPTWRCTVRGHSLIRD